MSDIHEAAIVSPDARLGKGVKIGPFCVVGPDVELGDGVCLHNGVTIHGRTRVDEKCEIFPGVVIGTQPQILGFEDIPESRIEIGARTIIRENATIHPGSKPHGGLTKVGTDCLLMVGVHIAHDCHIGDHCVFANQVTLGGNVWVEDHVWLGGLAAAVQHSRIGKHAFSAGGAIITGNIIPYGYVLGNRARLVGLNTVGLKRRGFSRKQIHALRSAYRMLFAKEGSFVERVADTKAAFADSDEVGHILQFIETYEKQALVLPE